NIQPPVRVQIKDKAMGVTDSWNRIYQYFKMGNYDVCCLSNDDVLFAPHALNDMASTLGQNGFAVVGPVSNQPGHQPEQSLGKILGLKEGDKYPVPPKNVIDIEAYLLKFKSEGVELPYINGFCFMFDRWITNFEHSKDMLFNPENINIGNEDELQRRLRYAGQKVALSLPAYVYHKKFGTMNLPAYRRNRNLLWTEAEETEKDERKVGQGV
ncbi:MAG: hypothetical protein QMD05_10430, partial [Candidatus Brocadiaceae bacterium]|nr:hypothetical protein [Candidatus Brocadiaceae bacterium]